MFRDHAIATLKAVLPELQREFGVESLFLFGSVARGDDTPDSDIDALVTFRTDATVTLITLGKLNGFLENLLGRKVDVVEDHPRLRPAFRRAIDEDKLRVA